MRKARAFAIWLATGFVAANGIGCRNRPPGPSESEALRVTEGFLPGAGGVGLYYRKVGVGPVVILPGRLFSFDDFRRLAQEGRTLIAYDMRNRGRSESIADSSALTIEADVEDLEAVRRHFGVETFTPIGYSYLGLMVVLYAVEHPDRVDRIVQLGPVPIRFGTEYPPDLRAEFVSDPEVVSRLGRLRSEQMHVERPQEYCVEEWSSYVRPLLAGDPSHVDRMPPADFMCSMPNEWPIRLALHFQHHFASVQRLEPPLDGIRRLNRPVLTIHGRLDRNAPYGGGREWATTLPDARLLTIDRAAHQSFAEYPEVVRPAIRTFLAGQWPPEAEVVSSADPVPTAVAGTRPVMPRQ